MTAALVTAALGDIGTAFESLPKTRELELALRFHVDQLGAHSLNPKVGAQEGRLAGMLAVTAFHLADVGYWCRRRDEPEALACLQVAAFWFSRASTFVEQWWAEVVQSP